jgi:hypothetical protein
VEGNNMKKWGLILSLLVILSLVLVSTGAAQTGVGFIQQIFAKRVIVTDSSSGAALTVTQAGGGVALLVNDSTGFPEFAIDDTGDAILAPDKTGGNEGAVVNFTGVPNLRIVGTGAGGDENDGNETVLYIDATPAGEWLAVDADTVCATEAAYSRDVDGTSLEIDFTAAADANDGCFTTVPANLDWTNLESVGFWLYVEDKIGRAHV